MTWVYPQRFIKSLDFVDWIKEHLGKINSSHVWWDRQIGSSNFSEEDSISSENAKLFAIFIGKYETCGFESMTWGGDDSGLNVSDFELGIFGKFHQLKFVDLSFRTWTHDDWNLELGVGTNEICMVVR